MEAYLFKKTHLMSHASGDIYFSFNTIAVFWIRILNQSSKCSLTMFYIFFLLCEMNTFNCPAVRLNDFHLTLKF